MKNNELVGILNDYADDYGMEGLLDELFPGMSIGELVHEMYESGLLPSDILEKFLNDE